MSADTKPYPEVEPSPSFPALEERVLARWKAERTFERSVESRPASSEYVFYDGPPFANGLPHYGHLLTGYVKDVIPRYQTMRGKRVERRFGWDCHGLPAEMEAEKQLELHGRAAIQAYGIERFNAHCKSSVLRYVGEWERFVTRQARWVDFRRDYKTMDLSYMESVMWAFARLHEKGLVYEGYRVMPYSWAAETPVSNFETRLDNSYRPRQDPAATVRFRLEPAAGDQAPLELWAWTTTPWTLPSNLALAVGAQIEYALFQKDGRRVVIGAAAAARYEKELDGAQRVGSVRGRELAGRRYEPLFPFFRGRANAFRVLLGDFVGLDEGTGIVHMAPGFGEDDQRVCTENGIELVCPVDDAGRFTAEVPPWAGVQVFEANKPILAALKQAGALVRHDTVEHNYPHCWRTDQPLIYRAISSWYVKVTAFRERMVELNRKIRWIPEHVRDGQFGKWLEGARDWSISRNRFWGSPIPVWRSPTGKLKVFGSIAELERASGQTITDLHRPFIDEVVVREGGEEFRRVPEVLDCWFESGSMPFAQVHYPFENREWFESHAPADFITEYVAQTRGWFYTLMVLSTALFEREPFRSCICHGTVLDENGQKLSKRLKNYPSPEEVFSTHGADALRWFLCSSPILRGADLQIDREGTAIGEAVRLVLKQFWSAYYFYTLYANADGVRAKLRADQQGLLDRYALAKTRALVEVVTRTMDEHDLPAACAEIRGYLDALNNWYIRRSRERFWREQIDADKQDAYDTLYTCLHVLCRAAAPLMPMVTEEVYRGLTGEPSVHLAEWPDAEALPRDSALVGDMDLVRSVCSRGLEAREAGKRRVRLPLTVVKVEGAKAARLEPYVSLIKDELNVRDVELLVHDDSWDPTKDTFEIATLSVKYDSRKVGPLLGSRYKELLARTTKGSVNSQWLEREYGLRQGEHYAIVFEPMARSGNEHLVVRGVEQDLVLGLDISVNPELEREGLANDVVRAIQQARKDAKLDVSDRIRLRIDAPEDVLAAVKEHASYLREQTLAQTLDAGAPDSGMSEHTADLDGRAVRIGLARVGA